MASLNNNPPINIFHVHSTSGVVTSRDTLDYERERAYVVLVELKDGGRPSKTTEVMLVVRVLDEDDHAPIFSRTVYYMSVDEAANYHMCVLRLGWSGVVCLGWGCVELCVFRLGLCVFRLGLCGVVCV